MKLAGIFTAIIILPLFITITVQSSPYTPPHFIKSTTNHSNTTTQHFFELTHPLPTDTTPPSCSVSLLNHSFANTYNKPPVTVIHSPEPNSTCHWSVAVLEFRAECKGEQYDRIAGVWIDGVEVLRTSTAQPNENGIFWIVRKDVTRYASLILKPNFTVTVMLENLVNDEFTGVYHVNVSLLFYAKPDTLPLSSIVPEDLQARKLNRLNRLNRKLISVKHDEIGDELGQNRGFRSLKSLYPYDKPADLIVPVSVSGGFKEGFWFRIEDEHDVKMKNVEISNKAYKAVLELYVSFHGNDEFWYMNPSDLYMESNNLTTGRGHGAYREVLVTIDGKLVGSVVPFPVIFTGGINPLFWEPVVSIGAFNLPSYDIDFTPFLGLLLDNKSHSIGIRVADGISFWLVDANLHLWLDDSNVQAWIVKSNVPSMEIEREDEFVRLDGEFKIKGERNSEVTGMVHSSKGNMQIRFTETMKFKNKIKFKEEGSKKIVDQRYKRKTKIKITNESDQLIESLEVKVKYPIKISTDTKPGLDANTSLMTTKVEQERSERFNGGKDYMELRHKQNCTGLMVVKGHSVLSGSAENQQSYNYNDDSGCYSRMVDVVDGAVVGDNTSSICVD
ncbi:hypothetical protein QVD17_31247 [Tagetes erecta]|uniref:Peptide N-acetyl-beta-D-glucosaminyl asparaginase amidase A N-terminal domain-containing protein n=1 Tax=Tagetes erecta TaxID=13708 RepID=A0AAD8K9E0_TARER|nr:hypothetical protein QVD17_31247 [Tagetes erecta]